MLPKLHRNHLYVKVIKYDCLEGTLFFLNVPGILLFECERTSFLKLFTTSSHILSISTIGVEISKLRS